MQRLPNERDAPVIAYFRAAAERYLPVIDTATDDPDPYAFLARVGPALADLCAAAFQLPRLWDDGWTFRGQRSVSAKVKAELAIDRRLHDLLAGLNYYESIAPFDTDEGKAGEPVPGFLSDDLSSVYGDVEQGLLLLGKGASDGEAAWVWYEGYWTHWGEHAVEALRVIYERVSHYRFG